MTVERLLAEISSAELTYWMAYYQLEPFGEAWLQTGVLASTVANSSMAAASPVRPSDFLPVPPSDPDLETDKRRLVSRILQGQRIDA